jgi:predicted DNA-binding transcriptional regulator YafY
VTGWDHESREIRTFRLDRVRSAEVWAETFKPPAEFDPVAQVLAGLAAVPWTHAVSVILHTDLESARRRIPVSLGAVEEVAGGVRLTFRAERLAGAADMLAGLGWPFVVEQPAELRDEVRAVAHRLLASA